VVKILRLRIFYYLLVKTSANIYLPGFRENSSVFSEVSTIAVLSLVVGGNGGQISTPLDTSGLGNISITGWFFN
jgi:hypothetical protein